MGPANPWSPNWRPDPTGQRAASIRSSRRGAFWAGLLLWPLVPLAAVTTPGVPTELEPRHLLAVAALTWPGLALLGAGLAPAAVGSRIDALIAGVALGIGAPLAAIASMLITVVPLAALFETDGGVGAAVGTTIRLSVLGGLRFAPLVALAVVLWLLLVRRLVSRPITD
jgi:hypothetical protein